MKMYLRRTEKLLALLLVMALMLCAAPAAVAESFSAFVKSGSMSVYSDAALTNRIGSLGQYTVVTVLEYAGGVARIQAGGNTGYARVSDMDAVEAVAVKGVVTTATRAYQSPSTSSASVGLPAGTQVNVIKIVGRWALIERGGIGAFTNVSCLSPLSSMTTPTPEPTAALPSGGGVTVETFTAAVSAASAEVYRQADEFSDVLGTLSNGTEVTVTAYTADWAQIELFGSTGYVRISDLTRETSSGSAEQNTPTAGSSVVPATVTGSNARVYASASASGKYLGTMVIGTAVNVLAIQNGWAYIEMSGHYGFCEVAQLTANSAMVTAAPAPTAAPTPAAPANSIPGTVVAASVLVYQQPKTSSKCLGGLTKGAQVNVLAIQGGWAYIELAGNYGFCQVSALQPTSALATPEPTATPAPTESTVIPATVTGSDARVYASASTSGKYLGTMVVGTAVNVLAAQNGWAYIEMSGHYGYCQLSQLTANSELNTPAPTAPAGSIPGKVTVTSLSVYQQPNTSAKVVAALPMNTVVNVIAIQNGWAYVELSGNYGFCLVSGLTPATSASPEPTTDPSTGYVKETFSATVVVSGAKLYAQPDTGSQSQSLSMGVNVTVSAYTSEWAYVDFAGVKGFVKVSALNRNEYATLGSGSSGSNVNLLEKALLALGYFDAQPGTTYSSFTENAVKRFQAACGMTATGTADQATQRVLYGGSAPACSLLSGSYAAGSKGDSVTRIQTRLLALGYLSKASSVDGDFGTKTQNAVKLFQSCNGLTASGTADSATLKKMYSTSAASLPSGKTPADVSTVVDPSPGDQKNNSTTISSTLASKTTTYSSGMSNAEKLEYVIYVGQNQLGKPYVYGANGTSSYDCTGFTCYCFKQIGITLPRTAVNQGYSNTYTKIGSVSELRRGDLVYFNTISDGDLSDHAGIYLGAGYFIHASSGQGKVVVSSLASGYYNQVFSWGRRVFN